MMPNRDWKDFWPLFESCSSEIQQDILQQLDLKQFLKKLSIEQRKIVTKSAPAWVLKPVKHLLIEHRILTDAEVEKYCMRLLRG